MIDNHSNAMLGLLSGGTDLRHENGLLTANHFQPNM
jgi:hypothetical protein